MRSHKAVLMLSMLAMLACGDDSAPVTPIERPPVARVELVAPPPELLTGETVRLRAIPRTVDGEPLPDRGVTWSSSDATIAMVAADGLVTAKAAGTTTLRATSEGRHADAVLRVRARVLPVAQLSIVGEPAFTMQIGAARTVQAEARAADGTLLDGRVVTWSSSQPQVAAVSAQGIVTALAFGDADISATIEGHTASAAVHVAAQVLWVEMDPTSMELDVGEVRPITASPRGAGNTVVNTPVSWSSSDPSIASVAGAGRVTAHRSGQAWITATAEGTSGRTLVTVTPRSFFVLETVDGSALPAAMFTRIETDAAGRPRNARFEVRAGSLRLTNGSTKYEQSFFFWIHRDGQPLTTGEYITIGDVTVDFLSGVLIFEPMDGSPVFSARPGPDGSWVVRQRYAAELPQRVLSYRRR